MTFLTAAALATVMHYTVPSEEGHPCDSVYVQCPSLGAPCDTFIVHTAERMGSVEIWWAPSPRGAWRLLYSKSVAGLEGLRDTASVPDSAGSTYLIAVDAAGNRACMGNTISVNLPPVAVPWPAPRGKVAVVWFDVQGRVVSRADQPPRRRGVFWRLDGRGRRQVVVVR